MTMLLLIAASPAAAQASQTQELLTADQVLANYRLMFKPVDALRCPKGGDGEIVVCAAPIDKQGPQYDPVPGERPGRVAGEPPRGAVGGFSCLQSCHQPLMINLLKAPRAIKNGIARILGKD
jgi:hypothetical protein